MINYFEQLEHRKDFFLHLIPNPKESEHDLSAKATSDASLYSEFEELFKYSKELIVTYTIINEDLILNMHKSNMLSYDEHRLILSEMLEIDCLLEESQRSDFKPDNYHTIEAILTLSFKISSILSRIFNDNNEFYLNLGKRYAAGLNKLKRSSIIMLEPKRVYKEFLSDSWFITPNNHLYNAGDDNCHKETSLVYLYDNLSRIIMGDISLEDYYSALVLKRNNLLKAECINQFDFMTHLNFSHHCFSLSSSSNLCNALTYNRDIFKTVFGVVEAKMHFCKFFFDLQRYATNCKIELIRLNQLTQKSISDILVRCCQFSKVESTADKTIVTSVLNYKQEFNEYIQHGWNVSFIPPIIISRDTGKLVELNMKSCIVQSYLEKLEACN